MENRIYEYLSVFIMSWLLVYGLTPFIMKLALWANVVDKPQGRKATQRSPADGWLECLYRLFPALHL